MEKKRNTLKRTLRSATLVETLVAMIIVMTAFGLAMMIYMNVLGTGTPLRTPEVQLLMKEVAEETKTRKAFVDEELMLNGLRLVKTISRYGAGSNVLREMHIEAFDNSGKKLAERKEVVIVEEKAP